ncbi:MAG TPA: tetratricopeptide repeat protein [Flavobacteriales bacterium]|nr:tetratricopeptide repeat protein [Flavobacteriales bacterium]
MGRKKRKRKRRQPNPQQQSIDSVDDIEGKLQQAISLHQAGQLQQAEQICQQILRNSPQHADALHLLGVIAYQVGENNVATSLITQAIKIDSNQCVFFNSLGSVLQEQGRLRESIQAFNRALEIQPDYADVHYNKGNTLKEQGKLEEAVDAYQQAIRIQPNHPEAYNNLGNVLQERGRLEESIQAYHKAIEIQPNDPRVYSNLGNSLQTQGRIVDAVNSFRQSLIINPNFIEGHSNLIFAQDFHLDIGLQEQQIERQKWNQRFILPLANSIQSHPNDRNPERRIRIGYVSANFRQHSAAQGFGQLILNYNQTQFDVFCYSGVVKEDEITKRFKDAVSGWYSTLGKSDKKLVEQIRNDEIDILVDLSGHTSGNRLLAFGYKPAPIQVTGIGHDAPGVTMIDYRLTTPIKTRPEEEKHFVEKPVYLGFFMGFMSPLKIPPVGYLPAYEKGHVTFGCLNRFSKVSDESLGLWASLLKRIPNLKLLFKSGELSDIELREDTINHLGHLGVAPNRVILFGRTSQYEHLNTYNQVDISLDPFPYGGGATTLESLCMGSPVVSLTNDSKQAHRYSSAILSPLGLNEWVAKTKDEYVEIVCHWANDLENLAQLRDQLRGQMEEKISGFVPQVEIAYREMWRRWCGGEEPSSIYIK